MRPREIVLILLSIIVIVLAGFGPLFGSRSRGDTIRQECEMFYRAGGQGAVAQCLAEMLEGAARVAR